MARRTLSQFIVSAIPGYAGDLLFNTEVLIPLATELPLPAGPVHPVNANAVSELQMIDGCALFYNATADFVPENQWFFGDGNDLGPITIGHVQVRMADAASLDLDQHLMRSGRGPSDLFDTPLFFEFVQDGGLHPVPLNSLGV